MHLDLKSTIRRYYQIWLETNELYSQWAEQHGITINTLLVLYMVRNTERCTQTDLCRMLMLPKQTVNSILKTLKAVVTFHSRRTAPTGATRSSFFPLKAGITRNTS